MLPCDARAGCPPWPFVTTAPSAWGRRGSVVIRVTQPTRPSSPPPPLLGGVKGGGFVLLLAAAGVTLVTCVTVCPPLGPSSPQPPLVGDVEAWEGITSASARGRGGMGRRAAAGCCWCDACDTRDTAHSGKCLGARGPKQRRQCMALPGHARRQGRSSGVPKPSPASLR
jgi:hypothetical protein